MTEHYPAASSSLAEKQICLITNQVYHETSRRLFRYRSAPDTIMIYQQAILALKAQLSVVNFDEAIHFFLKPNSFPGADLVVNLSGGFRNLELELLAPAMAGYREVPIFPATGATTVLSENKLVAKFMASQSGFRIAETLPLCVARKHRAPVIVKPTYSGDSVGIYLVDQGQDLTTIENDSFIEEFIPGADLTIHLLRSPTTGGYRILECKERQVDFADWRNEHGKRSENLIFSNKVESPQVKHFRVDKISADIISAIRRLMENMQYPYIARIDFRRETSFDELRLKDLHFLEVNCLPTISNANNWWDGILGTPEIAGVAKKFDVLPIHPAAKSLAYILEDFYDQSLSMLNSNEYFSNTRP